jgi:hypothetical protein
MSASAAKKSYQSEIIRLFCEIEYFCRIKEIGARRPASAEEMLKQVKR